MASYDCTASLPEGQFEGRAEIADEAIIFHRKTGACFTLPFADLIDMRLLNYHLHLTMDGYKAEISQLGYHTEDFFEKVWQKFEAESRKALFVAGNLIMESEGDYAYTEPETTCHGIAKIELYPDCLCVYPHDAGARRIPLCFAEEPLREGFALSLALDTGEAYRIARLGGDTDPFFSRLIDARDKAVASWNAAHRALDDSLQSRLGDAAESYKAFQSLPARVVQGLFSADDDAFWFAALAEGKAAVELVTNEKTALYLYEFDVTPDEFEMRIRHAMEAVKTNRRVIYVPDEELPGEPLYRMAIRRSSHVRLLRNCNVGRIIHSGNWTARIAEFFA